jgi:hypothetical protein
MPKGADQRSPYAGGYGSSNSGSSLGLTTVQAAKDGSIHALALIIACKVHPSSEKFIRGICLGGNTDALVNEIANNLHAKRHTILRRIVMNKEIRNNINSILL